MKVEIVQTPKVSAHIPLVVATGSRWLFLPGHTAMSADGQLPEADLIVQAKAVYRNIALSLAEVNADFSNIVKLNAFVVGFDPTEPELLTKFLTAISEVADELGQPQPPMLSLFGVQALGVPKMLVEVEGIAVLD